MSSSAGQDIGWVYAKGLVHVLADNGDPSTERGTVDGLAMTATAPVYSVAPSLGMRRTCQRLTLLAVALPEIPTAPTVF